MVKEQLEVFARVKPTHTHSNSMYAFLDSGSPT